MVRDSFVEIMVKKKKDTVDRLVILVIAIISLALAAAFFYIGLLLPFCFVLGGLSLFFGYFFISRRTVEFEYSLTNDLIDVDKIIAKRNRKRLVSANCKNLESFGRFDPDEHALKTYEKKVFACTSPKASDLWYFVVKGSNEGNTLLVFNGNERLLEGFKAQLPRHMSAEVFGRE